MTRREVPEPWATAMIHAGITHPRNPNQPSMGQLAQRVGVHTSTISSMVFGERSTDQATIDATADILRLDPTTVAEWAGRARTVKDPYTPPTISSLMDQDQRQIVDSIIRQFTAHARAAGTDHDEIRTEVETVEGVKRMGPAKARGLLRSLVRRQEELVGKRRLTRAERDELEGVEAEIAHLTHTLTEPAHEPAERDTQTGT